MENLTVENFLVQFAIYSENFIIFTVKFLAVKFFSGLIMFIKTKLKYLTISIVILFISSIFLKSQDIEVNRTFIGGGLSGILPSHSSYGDESIGMDLFFRHNFRLRVPNSYYCINANFLNYKNDYIRKNDYSVTLGTFFITDPLTGKDNKILPISLCFGINFGVLYKNDLFYGCLSIDQGFVIRNIYKNLNFEVIIKTKLNPSDKTHTDGVLGLSYSF